MSNTFENCQLPGELNLIDKTHSFFSIHISSLLFIQKHGNIIESRLTFPVTLEIYKHIEKNALFNLKPEIRSPFVGDKFLSETDITIEITLQPDLLPQLLKKAKNPEEAATYFLNLSQQFNINQEDINPLLNTESWLCLSVKQTQESGEIGYHTFWNYVNPSNINNPNISREQISENVVNFFKEWSESSLYASAQNATSEMLNSIGNVFKDLVNQTFLETDKETTASQTIFEGMVNFFVEDDWSFVKIEENTALRLGFQGENAKWNCYAKARETAQQFVFYSLSPINAPKSKIHAVAEFITRANYGIINGNFELDFNDGEIRYKTSIDVDGDRLSFALIKQLVYANVTMMDAYLPGIISVIYEDVSAEEAINQIELTPDIPQASEEQEQLLSVVPAENQPNLAVNPSSQAEIQQEPEKPPYILARLTPEEIGQLHQALQMLEPYQRKQTQEIIEKVKRLIITRLGDLGTEVFDEALTFFTKVKFPVIILKLIQRYAKMAGRTKLFIEQLKDRVKQYREPFDNSEINISIEDLEKLFAKIDKRLEELPTDKLLGDKELIYLLEIEQFNEQLAFFERLIKNLPENPASE